MQETYDLPTNVVNTEHLVEMLKLQEDLAFTLTPGLHVQDVLLTKNRQFAKMKVNRAKKILSPEVGAALYFLADENSKPEYITTAWFVSNIAKWFRLMTSRNLQNAISTFDRKKYEETISFLREMVNLLSNLRVGDAGIFKSLQKGFMLSTTSAIQLSQYLLEKQGFKFVLTSRFTQDCVENLFSLIRSKHVTPNVLQFKYDLRLISISQYIKPVKTSNYEFDDSTYLVDFLNTYEPLKLNSKNIVNSTTSESSESLDQSKRNKISVNVEVNDGLKTENALRKVSVNILPDTSGEQNNAPTSVINPYHSWQQNPQSHFEDIPMFLNDDQRFFVNFPSPINNVEKNALYQAAGHLIYSL